MLVSVIVPNYNHARFLVERIETILNQSFQDFELILLDDCSSDGSEIVLEQYRNNPKVSKIVYNEVNSGSPFNQWLKGIEISKGEIVWIAESDDYCEPNFLETLVKGIKHNSNCCVAFAQSYCVDDKDNIIFQSRHSKLEEYVDSNFFLKNYLLYGNGIFNASMAIFKKKHVRKFSAEFCSYKFCGDWLFWINMTRFGDVYISGKVLNFFRKHGDDVSGKMFSTGYNYIEELMILKKIKQCGYAEFPLIEDAVFMRYRNFLLKQKQFNALEIKVIKEHFYNFFSGSFSFNKFYFFHEFKKLVKKKRR